VSGSNRFTHRCKRYLAATPDEQDAQRHRSFAPNIICFGVKTDTGQDSDQVELARGWKEGPETLPRPVCSDEESQVSIIQGASEVPLSGS
jgi:hypothetical protein